MLLLHIVLRPFSLFNTFSHTTPHVLLPLPTIWPPHNCHSQLHFSLKFKCSWAFQHLSLLCLICKNTRGPKRSSTDLVICTWDTLSRNNTPAKNRHYQIFYNTSYQQPTYQQKASQTSFPLLYRNNAFVLQRTTLETTLQNWRRHSTKHVLTAVTLAGHWSRACLDLQTEVIIRDVPFRKFITQ